MSERFSEGICIRSETNMHGVSVGFNFPGIWGFITCKSIGSVTSGLELQRNEYFGGNRCIFVQLLYISYITFVWL